MLRAYFQDLKLWGVFKRPLSPQAQAVQVHQGVDAPTSLVLPIGNATGELVILNVWEPETSLTWLDFRAREKALRAALQARAVRGPVCIVDDDNSAVVASVAASVLTLTAPPYAFQVNDYVLVRTLAVGGWTFGQVSAIGGWPPYTITVTTIQTSGTHTFAIGDDVHKVELSWGDMSFLNFPAIAGDEGGDYFARDVPFTFNGVGRSDDATPTVDLDD
jgi:hypothetical protein